MLPANGVVDKPWDLRDRSLTFAVTICQFCRTLPPSAEAQDITRQLRRSACAVAANYRSARRGKSHRDFASKLGTVIEEADEAHLWLELLVRIGLVRPDVVEELMNEATQLVKIFTACQKTARKAR